MIAMFVLSFGGMVQYGALIESDSEAYLCWTTEIYTKSRRTNYRSKDRNSCTQWEECGLRSLKKSWSFQSLGPGKDQNPPW
jgi:hypothetical protein